MNDYGKASRLKLLEQDAESKIFNAFRHHNWECVVESIHGFGEYLVLSFKKGDVFKKVGYLYSSATDNSVYKALDTSVDLIVTNGRFYHIDSFARGVSTEKLLEVGNIHSIVEEWNGLASKGKFAQGGKAPPLFRTPKFSNRIQSETPILQIWSRLRQFSSVELSKKLIKQRYEIEAIDFVESGLEAKAEGLAFCIQNACDYFDVAKTQKSNQQIVSLYYGGIALASAEMLASPHGPNTLDEVESMTKFGHGLFTIDGTGDNQLESLIVGPLSNGFFKKWVEFIGVDTSRFLSKKPKTSTDIGDSEYQIVSFIELLSRVPELEGLFPLVTDAPFNWLAIYFDSTANRTPMSFLQESAEKIEKKGSYIKLFDYAGNKDLSAISEYSPLFEQISYGKSNVDDGVAFSAYIKHPNDKYWYNYVNLHKSPFCGSRVILPLFKVTNDYRVICIVIFYTLSILVRYRPSIWRQIEGGIYDSFRVLIEEMIAVYLRVMPEHFLSAILDKRIHTTQPGSLNSEL